jgi:aldose 1-epimerase
VAAPQEVMKQLVILLVLPGLCLAQQFSVRTQSEDGTAVIHLVDAKRDIDVSIVPAIGNRAIAMKVHGANILYFPYSGLREFKEKPVLNGVPFLAPWANRLDGPGYWAEGKKYILNTELHNYQTDGNGLPIHGLLSTSALWRVVDQGADQDSAHVTSRLEFWKYPELMAQWPFAQEYEMTYRLADGALEVRTTIKNLGAEPIPVSIGFHPFYRIPDKQRDEWTATLPVKKAVVADERKLPSGELKEADLPNPLPLSNRLLDDGFTDLVRDGQGKAHFVLRSGKEQVEVLYGPKYPVAVVWEPKARRGRVDEFICFEPMTAITDGINLNHEGKYPELQMVAPGASWTESFWIRPSGF